MAHIIYLTIIFSEFISEDKSQFDAN